MEKFIKKYGKEVFDELIETLLDDDNFGNCGDD